MLKFFTSIIFFVLTLSYSTFAQEIVSNDKRAAEILTNAKAAVTKSDKLASITGLSINYKTSRISKFDKKEINSTETISLHLIGLDKIRKDLFGEYETNTVNSSEIVNGEQFERNVEVFVEGQKLNAAFSFSTPKEIEIKEQKESAWKIVFPLTLDLDLYPNLVFSFVGMAESKDGKANIVQTFAFNKTFQFYFDQKTNLPLMMSEKRKTNENKETEIKYFFSDFRDEAGLTFPHKIISQSNDEKIGTSEIIIKSLKINPNFKSKFFEVKK
jgi:hypothetical protein